jgi:hypothetical protein
MGQRSRQVDRNLEALYLELDRAAQELEFLGSEGGFGFEDTTAPSAGRAEWDESPTDRTKRPAAVSPTDSAHERNSAFLKFTAQKYDRTVADLHRRRRRLLFWTVGFGIGISAALEVVNYLSHEVMPPIWLAILPAVWLLPVPFFLLAFRGTQRTLKANRLETGVGA